MDLINLLVTKEVAMIAVGIVAVLYFAGMIPVRGKRLGDVVMWRRLLPILPPVAGVGISFLPGVIDGDPTWGVRILVGLWSGLIAAHGRKIIKRGILDKFDRSGRVTNP